MQPVSSLKQQQQQQQDDTTYMTIKESTDTVHQPFQTPPIRPAPPAGLKSRKTTTTMSAKRKISPVSTEDDEEYLRFVQSLGQDDAMMASTLQSLLTEDDEEDFVLTDLEDDDDDDDDDDDLEETPTSPNAKTSSTALPGSPLFMEHDFYSELEAELGSLLEEDLEAAVSTLLAGTNKKSSPKNNTPSLPATPIAKTSTVSPNKTSTPTTAAATTTTTTRATTQMMVTPAQVQHLQSLLASHYQLLVQSSVLAVRAARKDFPEESPLVFHGGETPEDLGEIIDGAVGMLQDLDQVRCCIVKAPPSRVPFQGGGRG